MSANILANDGATQAPTRTTLHTRQRARRSVRPLLAALLIACCVTSLPAASQALDDDNLLLLDFNLERQRLASSVTAYSFGDTAVVSLAEAAAALEFPISVDPERGTASGWFIRPDRLFALNLDGRYVEIEGQRQPISGGEVLLYDNAIFVTLETFSRWFPVDLALDIGRLAVNVSSRERLPVEARAARRQGGRSFDSVGPATLPPIDTPYRFLGPHAADVGIGYSIRRHRSSGRANTGLSYSTLLAGDVAFMDSRIYLAGSKDDALSHARASLSRSDLRLPAGLRYIEVGDIVPSTLPGLGHAGVERGLLIQGGGSVIGRDDLIDGDLINISGDALEGWDVELFQNGMRVGFQSVGADGRYDFRDIEPTGGENVFELVFHGPSGEERRETVVRNSGLGPDQPGSIRYQFSVSEKGRQLYEGDELLDQGVGDRGETRMAAGAELRVLPRLAVRGGWNSLVVDGERLNYYSVGARTGIRDLTLSVDALRDPLDGTRWNGAIQLPASANLLGFDARVSHTHYAQGIRVDDGYETRLRSRTGLTLSRAFGATASRFGVFHNRELERNSTTASAGFTHRVSRFSQFGNTLNYHRYGTARDGSRESDRADGNFFFSTRANPLNVRGGVYYTLRPKSEVRQYFIDSTLRVAEDMTMSFGVIHTPGNEIVRRFTRYSSGLNWALPQVTLSPRLTYDSDGHYSGFVYASFSLAPRPDGGGVLISRRSLATEGAVAARVFIDNDGSGTFTEGDELLPNVTVRAPQASRNAETGSDGVALLTGMASARPTDVRLEAETLPGANLVPAHAGNSVRPRPTAVTMIDFPVVPTGDIEGTVVQIAFGSRSPLAGATVELRDARGELATTQVSAHDGYFTFIEVPYGSYTVTLSGARGERLRQPANVTVARDRPSVSGVELVVEGAEPPQPGQTPGSIVPVPAGSAVPATIVPAASAQVASASAASNRETSAAASSPSSAIATTGASSAARAAAERARPASTNGRPQPGSDGRLVQLGAFSDPARAQIQRDAIVARGVLDAGHVSVVAPESGNGVHRILASPNGGSARALCESLSARGVSCFTVAN